MTKILGLLFFSFLAMVGRLPHLLVPGTGATSTLKTAIAPSTGMIERTAGLVFRRIASASPFWNLGRGPRCAS
jgi:hypothetical protein